MVRPRLIASAFGILAIVGASAQAVVNGDFELAVPSNSTGNGWTSFNIDGAGGWGSTGGNPNGNFILNNNGAAETDPSLLQTITGLTPGQAYLITGNFTNVYPGFGDPSALSFGVAIDGLFLFSGSKGTADTWQAFAVAFVAPDTDVDLLIAGERNGDDSSYRVDNVQLAVVPEPATIAALGVGALLLARRRRQAR